MCIVFFLLLELDVEFRRSTPVHWLDDASVQEENQESAGTAALMYGVQHGGDALSLCQRSATSSRGSKTCTMNVRWVDALLRAGAKHRTQSKGIVKASKMKIKKWLKKYLTKSNVQKGVLKLRSLRTKINDEHHKLIKHVEQIFENRKTTYNVPNFALTQWLRVRPGVHVRKSNKRKNGALWVLEIEVAASATNNQKKIWMRHTFRNEMKALLDEVVERSKTINQPFQVKDFKSAKDHFERISLMNVLYQLKMIDKLEITREKVKQKSGDEL